jgi:hypothetical protein
MRCWNYQKQFVVCNNQCKFYQISTVFISSNKKILIRLILDIMWLPLIDIKVMKL